MEALKPHLSSEDYDLILYACGLLANQGICEEIELQGRLVKIDKYLIPMIKDLNEAQ